MSFLERCCPAVAVLVVVAALSLVSASFGQEVSAKQVPAAVAQGDVVGNETPAQKQERAWKLLTDSVRDAKHTDTRVQALAALSTMERNQRANELIAGAMRDPDLDVRTAAILAAGKSKSPSLATVVRKLLEDPEPQVAFAAATTLWTDFKDHSGEDILAAVADGDRKATPGLWHGARHDMSKTMHSPASIAKLGAEEGAGLLLGPFGFSIAAVEYMRKNGSDSARVQALDLLAGQKTPAARQEMLDALTDKDPGVRASAAKALGQSHMRTYATALAPLVDDAKLPVRLTAAAAYINCFSGSAAPAKHP